MKRKIIGRRISYVSRKMRRFKQQVSQDECKKILKDEKRAAFSVIGDEGYPYTIPINFYYEEADHTIYFHGSQEKEHKMGCNPEM